MVVINDVSAVPSLVTNEDNAASVCSGGTSPNGQLSVDVDLVNENPDALYQWYLGADVLGTALVDAVDPGNGSVPSGSTNPTVSGLIAGTYTVLLQ